MTEHRPLYVARKEGTLPRKMKPTMSTPLSDSARIAQAAMQRRAANKDSLTVSTLCERCHTTVLYSHDLRASRFPRYCAPCSEEMLTWLASASKSTTAR